MEKKAMQIKESTGIQFSLSFLIQIIATVIMAVWGYSQLESKITALENSNVMHTEQIDGILSDMKESQDKPISSDHVQNTTLFSHDRELSELRARIAIIEARTYDAKK